MKAIIFFSLFLTTFAQSSWAGPQIFCSLSHSKRVIPIARAHSTYDKNLHCSVSCMLALKCNDREVLLVGYLKEFQDALGAGNADSEDIKADAFGISLSAKGAAKTDGECLSQCDLYFHD